MDTAYIELTTNLCPGTGTVAHKVILVSGNQLKTENYQPRWKLSDVGWARLMFANAIQAAWATDNHMAAPKKEDVRSEGTEDVLTLSARQQLTSFHLVGKRGGKKSRGKKRNGSFRNACSKPVQYHFITQRQCKVHSSDSPGLANHQTSWLQLHQKQPPRNTPPLQKEMCLKRQVTNGKQRDH